MNVKKKDLCHWCKHNCNKGILSWLYNKNSKSKDSVDFVDISKFIVGINSHSKETSIITDAAKNLSEKTV